jgi:hypothetical protein
MTFQGIAHDGHLIKPVVTFSQTHYIGQSGREKVLTRIHDKVIPNEADLIKYLSSFDLIIAVDTNTERFGGDSVSASGIVQCLAKTTADPNVYSVEFPWHGVSLFRNCPQELSPEKYGWVCILKEISRDSKNAMKNICFVSDHDRDNHGQYNSRSLPIFSDIYFPPNFTIMYGKGDSSKESLLNHLVHLCHKESKRVLKGIENGGFCTIEGMKIHISQIPIPALGRFP